ncbi:uncharacterized protein K444DRAFT_381780 [Hyaloscypha bicolor E]|uniref:Uncharacterized protein n=1 Tax=Hyaloscypha bicolor E TaxID=1095630 RepID=A0A2J6TCX5_9HELO|nr:uncharacterized protein K444DRAFT_381780 [Hyaloscypha bicolor E]PMD60853.1 hypothetical protein K444DRAFT_381780 [Hyaloscypha bicolor E]
MEQLPDKQAMATTKSLNGKRHWINSLSVRHLPHCKTLGSRNSSYTAATFSLVSKILALRWVRGVISAPLRRPLPQQCWASYSTNTSLSRPFITVILVGYLKQNFEL